MRVILEDGAFMPERAHTNDAGLDIRAIKCGIVKAGQSAIFHTGVHIELPPGTFGDMRSKSGLMFNHDITSDGTIDAGYQGEIMVKLFNHSSEDYNVRRGDKISQLVISPVVYVELEQVEAFDVVTERSSDGFGSTGR
jgi:dUTP pyrophosphatase